MSTKKQNKIYVKVTITFRDDSVVKYHCSDSPTVGGDDVVIYPLEDPLGRIYLRKEFIAQIHYTYDIMSAYDTGRKKTGSSKKGRRG